MELRGSLFEDECTTGAVSCVFTNFYVDHGEPLEALAVYKGTGRWVLGELLDGHEFLIILFACKRVYNPTRCISVATGTRRVYSSYYVIILGCSQLSSGL